jgi:putative transposase
MLPKGHRYVPRNVVTDKLRSYGTAKEDVMPLVAHHTGRMRNNRAENSHQPVRERERRMQRFKSIRHAQRFLSVHGQVSNHFRPGLSPNARVQLSDLDAWAVRSVV